MCRKGAWAELTVQVTFRARVQSRMHGFKIILFYLKGLRVSVLFCFVSMDSVKFSSGEK